jgi:signal transduction histidine kinase/ligand-binding sensor domain-containing protein
MNVISLKAFGLRPLATCIALFAPLCAFESPLLALDNNKTLTQYAHRVWNQEEGLLEPSVYSILQTHDGYLWLGTQNGLIRFDGERFRPVKIDRSVSGEFEPVLIRALYEDPNHVLWVASIGNGLGRRSGPSRRWFTSRDGLPSDIVSCVVPSHDGSLWLCTNAGLVKFRDGVKQVYTKADGLPTDRVHAICEAKNGTTWVSLFDGGLSRMVGNRFETENTGIPELNLHSLTCAQDNSLWAGTENGLLHLTHSNAGWSVRRFTIKDGLPDDSVSTAFAAADGSLWVGTRTGIARFHDGEWSAYGTNNGLSHTGVLAMFVDRESSLWVGTKNGLDQFTDGHVTPYTTSEGLPSNDTGPVVEDASGTLWLGTKEDGLARYDGHRFKALTRRNGLADDSILSLAVGPDGALWVGTPKGLTVLRKNRVVRTYTTADGLPSNRASSLFFDALGALWVGTGRGLATFDHDRFSRPSEFQSLNSEPIVALGGGRSTRLFASTSSGRLYTLRNGEVSSYMPPDPTRAIASYYADPDHHTLWMGTLGSGLIRWKNGILKRIRTKDGLFDDQIYGILRDDQANLWFASSKGIFRVSMSDLDGFADGSRKSIVSLPFSTGQLRFECQAGVQPAAFRTRDGRLWFSTTNGLVVVDPNRLQPNRLPPPAQIETVFVNGQRRETDAPLSLSHNERNLEIRYTGLSFVAPEKATFRYKLNGFDKDWIQAGNRREALYTNLPPGHYSFTVLAANSDGVWSTRPATAEFTIEPLLYQRAWFFPLIGLWLAVTCWLGYQMRIRQLKGRFRLVLSERTRIARELHDTLLQGMSGVTMQLQALWMRLPGSPERQVLSDIIKDAAKCQTEARHSLWGLRTPDSDKHGLGERIAQYAREAVKGAPVRLSLHLPSLSTQLSPDVEYQLFRIAREAISNTLRHAEAESITVRLESRDDTIELSVKDDGKGFEPHAPGANVEHFGVIGMRERASEIGAQLSILSAPGSGAEILLTIQIKSDGRNRLEEVVVQDQEPTTSLGKQQA